MVTLRRLREEQRAEADRIQQTQKQLGVETLFNQPLFGLGSLRKVFARRGLTSLLGKG